MQFAQKFQPPTITSVLIVLYFPATFTSNGPTDNFLEAPNRHHDPLGGKT